MWLFGEDREGVGCGDLEGCGNAGLRSIGECGWWSLEGRFEWGFERGPERFGECLGGGVDAATFSCWCRHLDC